MDSYYRRRTEQKRKKTKGKFGITVLLLAIVGLIGGIALVARLTFSEVRLTLIPSKESRTIEKKMALNNSITEIQTDPLVLPTRVIQVEVTEQVELEIESEIDLGAKARGIVKLVNETGAPVHLGLDTILRGPQNQEYEITKASTLPGAKVTSRGEIQFGEDLIEVIAKEPGEKSNIVSGRLAVSSVEASIRSKVYGQIQLSGIAGGTSRVVRAVTDKEIEQGRSQLEQQAREALFAKFRTQLSEDEILPEELILLKEVLSSVPEIGVEAETVTVRLTYTGKGFIMPKDQTIEVLQQEAQNSSEEGGPEINISGVELNSIRFEEVAFDPDFGRAEALLVVPIATWNEIDIEGLKQEIAGKSVPEARRILLARETIRDVRFVKRFWLSSTLPKNPAKISIELGG